MLDHKSIKPETKGTRVLFKNPVIERLTRTHIAIPLVMFSVFSSGLIYYGYTAVGLSAVKIASLFVIGMLLFTLAEYLMHRYLFHMKEDTERKKKLVYTMHGVHHHYPKDKDRLAMPIPASITLSVLFYLFFKLIMGDLVYGFLPGFFMGYASYLWVHYMVHAFQPPKNFFKILWVHHGIHHYKEPERAFGVSSPLWDVVFGTMPTKG
jgi:sterol desaturase/sphingolipid hydroxylase (fatty acid hydroxylase superfamily)